MIRKKRNTMKRIGNWFRRFRSWYIILTGMIIQFLLGCIIFIIPNITIYKHVMSGLVGLFMGFITISGVFFGVIPLLLLAFKKTRKIGGLVSIIFGIISYIVFPLWIIISIFMVIAGIIALWKGI